VKLTKILAGIKELEEIDRQLDGVKSKGIQKEKSLSPIDRLGAVALGVPVNKARPSDILKQSDCQSFVRKINREKRERQMRMDEIRKKEEEKLNAELDMNRAQEQYKIAQKELKINRKQAELERKIHERQENRQKSIQDMIIRTKAIRKSHQRLFQFAGVPHELASIDRLEQEEKYKIQEKAMRIKEQSSKYDEIIRQQKEQLRMARGGLGSGKVYEEQARNPWDNNELANLQARVRDKQQNIINKEKAFSRGSGMSEPPEVIGYAPMAIEP